MTIEHPGKQMFSQQRSDRNEANFATRQLNAAANHKRADSRTGCARLSQGSACDATQDDAGSPAGLSVPLEIRKERVLARLLPRAIGCGWRHFKRTGV
jgi:hypothetical protein